ncbi:hypothetical protein OPIT5_14925 [Opitutaceae bacterium TAV5]|nr:hypothetical protein OPIT5_14925 [Opitutaceae bacterium TAV5]
MNPSGFVSLMPILVGALLSLAATGVAFPASAAEAATASGRRKALAPSPDAPAVVGLRMRSGESESHAVTQLFADGFLVLPPARLPAGEATGSDPVPAGRFVPWGSVDLPWLLAEGPPLKPGRAISVYGGEKLVRRAVWLQVRRDDYVSATDTALRIELRRTTGGAGDVPVELECIFLHAEGATFKVAVRRVDLLALPLGASTAVWCAPKAPLLDRRLVIPPASRAGKRPLHWVVRIRSHREVIATAGSDTAIVNWVDNAHLPDPRSPFGGTWKNYGQ